MDGNRDDAERCLARAEEALLGGDMERARRLLEKSRRMFPLGALQARMAKRLASAQTSGHSVHGGQQAANSSRAASSFAAKPPAEEESVRAATPEMLAVVESVRRGLSDGHYGTLGISRTSSEVEIKKAFRKLALALHPDKNCAAGAEEAFKSVCRASEVLSDPARREVYNQYGVDDMSELRSAGSGYGMGAQGQAARQMRRRRKGPVPGRQRPPGYPRNLEEELDDMMASMTPEQLFDFLFSAARDADPQERAAQPPAQSVWTRYRPLTLLAAVAFCLMLVSGGSYEPNFSLNPSPAHTVRRSTPGVGVIYYVSRFYKDSLDRPADQARLENAVNAAAVETYGTLCALEHQRRDELYRMSRAWLARASTRRQYAHNAREFDMANCRERESLQERIIAHRLQARA
jgi:DnaJ homolog subfamily B member 12